MNEKQNRPKKQLAEKPITLSEIDHVLHNRIEIIEDEFKAGFNLIKKYNKTVTFFGSARALEDEPDFQNAKKLSEKIVKDLGYSVFSGGGPGIMKAANEGAFESGGNSVGLTIQLPKGQTTNEYLTEHLNFNYFFSRKVCLSFSAEAYVFFPGGFGTFDELFEILTLVQTKKIHSVPVILFGSHFWNKFDEFIKNNLLKDEKIDEKDVELYKITDSILEAVEIIKNAPVRNVLQV